jgi:hypothetical protein
MSDTSAPLRREAGQASPVWQPDHTPLALTWLVSVHVVMRQFVTVDGAIPLSLARRVRS